MPVTTDEQSDFLQQPPTPENLRRIGLACKHGSTMMSEHSKYGFRIITWPDEWELEHQYRGSGGIPKPATMGDLIAGLRFLGIPYEVPTP